jgi:hypothetical protein
VSVADQPIVTTETSEDYHAEHSAVGNSMLSTFIKSRRLYHARHVARTAPTEKKDCYDFGSASHFATLEPHRLAANVVVAPKSVLSKSGARAGNAWYDYEAVCRATGLIPLTEDVYAKVIALRDAVYANPIARELLEVDGEVEQSIRWHCDMLGRNRKARPDKYIPSRNIVIDLKTTHDSTPRGFANAIDTNGYDRQDVFYSDGIEAKHGTRPLFLFIAADKSFPHTCRVYRLNELDRDNKRPAREELDNALIDLRHCHETDDWREPGEHEIVELPVARRHRYASEWEINQGE